jgi:hypothetical protein
LAENQDQISSKLLEEKEKLYSLILPGFKRVFPGATIPDHYVSQQQFQLKLTWIHEKIVKQENEIESLKAQLAQSKEAQEETERDHH